MHALPLADSFICQRAFILLLFRLIGLLAVPPRQCEIESLDHTYYRGSLLLTLSPPMWQWKQMVWGTSSKLDKVQRKKIANLHFTKSDKQKGWGLALGASPSLSLDSILCQTKGIIIKPTSHGGLGSLNEAITQRVWVYPLTFMYPYLYLPLYVGSGVCTWVCV